MNNEKWEKIKELFNINREALSEIAFNPNLEIPKRIKKLFEGVEDDQIIDKLEKHVFLAIDNLVNNKITKLLEAVEYDLIKFKDIVGLYRVLAVHTALLHETHFRIISEQLPEIANRQRLTPNNLNTFNEARTFYLSENYLNEQALRMLANADFENLEAEYQLWDKRLEQSAVYKELKNKTSDIQNLLGKYEHLKLLFKNDIDKLAQSRITPLEFKNIALEQTANMAMAKASELSEPIRLFTLKIEGLESFKTTQEEENLTNNSKFLQVKEKITSLEGKSEQNKQDITNLRNSVQQQHEGNNTRFQVLENYQTQAQQTTQEIRQKITELESRPNATIPENLATQAYVNERTSNLAKTNISNTFTTEQIFNNIKLRGNNNNYIIQNDNNILKLKNGNNSLLEFNGDNLNGGALKTYIDNKLNTQKLEVEKIHVGRGEVYDKDRSTADYIINFGAHKRYTGSSSYRYEPNLQIKAGGTSTQTWQINSGRSGEEDNRIDIAFNASGLTTSTLKTYIDNAINGVRSYQPAQKDYKVYTSYKKIDLSDSSTWNKNVYNFPRNGGNNLTSSDNILGITINYIFKNNSSRSVSFGSLPNQNKGLAHSVIANDSSGNPHAFYFEIKQYGSNTSWHDFNVVYSGAHKLYDATWSTGNHVKSVEIWINYQK